MIKGAWAYLCQRIVLPSSMPRLSCVLAAPMVALRNSGVAGYMLLIHTVPQAASLVRIVLAMQRTGDPRRSQMR